MWPGPSARCPLDHLRVPAAAQCRAFGGDRATPHTVLAGKPLPGVKAAISAACVPDDQGPPGLTGECDGHLWIRRRAAAAPEPGARRDGGEHRLEPDPATAP